MNKLRKNKKGFTLIELIVVIVIIAILIAALTPAILGVIDRANLVADEAEGKNVMSAATVASMSNNYQAIDDNTAGVGLLVAEITGTNPQIDAIIYLDGPVAVGAIVYNAKSKASKTPAGVVIGDTTTTGLITVNYVKGAHGTVVVPT